MRIGHGFDVHAFGEGDHIVLGGVRIAHTQGLVAHSDGDVVLHALADALLGAAAMGDIGQHFPDTDAQWKNANSRDLLRHVFSLLQSKGYAISNVDITVIAQVPKLAPHKQAMCDNVASDLQLDSSQVNLKATTTERLGYIGREEGIAVHAVVCIQESHA